MTLKILLCAEDILSAALARDLCDRVVSERANADWLGAFWAPEHRDSQRRWVGLHDDTWWSDRPTCSRAADDARVPTTIRIRETGQRKGFHGVAGLAFRTVRLVAGMEHRPDLLVLAGDTDGVEDPARLRAAGVQGARFDEVAEALPVLVAEPTREAEAWVIGGFVPQNDGEHERLRAVERELGFDPTEMPERLLSNVSNDRRDTKRVCRALLGTDTITPASERVRRCWLDTPLDILVSRGQRTGLAAYVAQAERILLPLLGDSGRASTQS